VVSLMVLFSSAERVGTSAAQGPHESLGNESGAPDVPPGTAAIFGQLLHPDGNAKTAGSTILLYSLAADGSPGIRTTVVDASGVFRFSNLSSASGITYLVGASYAGIPYGKRVAFKPGQSEIALVIDVDDPSANTSLVSVGDTSLRVEWIGSSLAIEEIHQLENSGDEVIFVAREQRKNTQPPFRITLPVGAERLDTTLSGVADGYEVQGNELIFWGPVYADGLELRFRYQVPIARAARAGMKLRWTLDSGSRRTSLLFPPAGPTLSMPGISTGADVILGDRPFHALYLGEFSPGSSFEVAVFLPEMSNDTSAITFPRADVWLDADDTFLQVNFELHLEVAPGAHLTGSMEAPLITFALPPEAELRGYNQDAKNLGLLPVAGGLGLIGPLSPGVTTVGFTYRLPVVDSKPRIDLQLPGAVKLLNVLIADTGIIVKADRLHRLRPFRQGTRIYLHREAFSIDEGEIVSLSMDLINRGSGGRNTNLFATSLLAAMGVWFVVSPLVRSRRTGTVQFEQARIRSERDLVYAAIRDLELDFETAKIDEADYQSMRGELRGHALALLQRERDAKPLPSTEDQAGPAQHPAAQASATTCQGCGSELDVGWQFCPKCGASQSEHSGDDDTGNTDNAANNPAKANT
jgi:hypothetical protein